MPANITDVDTFTDPIVRAADGDVGEAATWTPGTQGLSNRTRYLRNKAGLGFGMGTGLTIIIPGLRWYPFDAGDVRTWSLYGGSLESIVNSGECSLSLDNLVPPGATITALDALVDPGAARSGGDRLKFYVTREDYNFGTPGYTAEGILGGGATYPTDTTGNVQVVPILNSGSSPILPQVHDPLTPMQIVCVAGNDGASNTDKLHALRVTFTWQ